MNLKEILQGVAQVEIKIQEDLTYLSTMRLKASGDIILIKSEESLTLVLQKLKSAGCNYRILGLGANQILPKSSINPYVKLNLPFDKSYFNEVRSEYVLPASVPLGVLTSHALKFGLMGWEVFTGIPATLGGAVFMNAGTELGEIGTLVKEIWMMTNKGTKKIVSVTDYNKYFSYRKNHFCEEGDLIYKVILGHRGISEGIPTTIRNYLNKRSASQPLDKKTCGCVFKNYSPTCRAGKFLDILNLKGLEFQGVRISPVHANFIENVGNASRNEFEKLVEIVNKEIKLQFGINFELEVKL